MMNKFKWFWSTLRIFIAQLIYKPVFKANDEKTQKVMDLTLKINNCNGLEDLLNNKYPKTDIKRLCRPDITGKAQLELDVRNFFTIYDSRVRQLVSNLAMTGTDDEKAVKCLSWIVDNIYYITDKDRAGVKEYWQFPYETLDCGSGDCEDMAILLANMMIISGIPYWRLRLSVGDVDDSKGNKGSHCFVTYYDVTDDTWVLLDCCYYPNNFAITDRPDYKKEKYYLGTDFSFNLKYCFKK